jgi:putative DNA primase/helicase
MVHRRGQTFIASENQMSVVSTEKLWEQLRREKAEAEPQFLSFAPFTMDPKKGLFITVERRRGKEEWQEEIWLSAPFEIIGRVRDPKSESWARLLQWPDDDGVAHQHPVADEDLHGDGSALCAALASRGLKIVTGSARQYFVSYLNQATIKARVTIVPRTGWQVVDEKKIFALPAEGIGIDDRIILAAEVTASHYTSYGTLQEWQNSVAKLAAAHGRARFAIASAFVSPLLALMGADGGGINLKGPSSIGKTSSLVLHRFGGVVMNAVSSEHGVALATVSRRLQLNSPTLFCRSTKSALPAVMRLAMSSTRLRAE